MEQIFILGFLFSFAIGSAHGAGRARDGLQVLYDFRSSDGAFVKDRSGVVSLWICALPNRNPFTVPRVFHAITSANGRFKTGQILEVGAEALDVYNTMLAATGASRQLGPSSREKRGLDAIRA